jgi:cytoskeletal protein CcmA (bactofilin family)
MIAAGTSVRGQITGAEDLTVEGRVEGSVRLSGNLSIAKGAEVKAEVEVKALDISGSLAGNSVATESVALSSGAVVTGDITTPRLVIADGARYSGRVTMPFEIPALGAPAPRR